MKKKSPVPAELYAEEHLVRTTLLYTMLVAVYHKTFAFGHSRVIDDRVITF